MLVTDPYPMPPVGSERVRWAQDCLNRALGLSLPLTGLMAAETRSALRRFQGQQALRPSGILGPDTEQALRVACAQRPPNADDGTEQELGPLTATLKWIDEPPNSGNAKLFSVDEAAKQKGGGVYILMGKQRGGRRSILKVGRTHAFAKRFGKDSVYRPRTLPKPPRSRERVSDEFEDLRVYLARITRYLFKDIQIEKAISRLLRRANLKLPADQLKFVPTPVLGNVRIKNILPRQLLDRVRMHAQTAPAVGSDATLTLTKTAYPQWETLPASELSSWSEVSRPHAPGCHCPKCRVAAAGIHNLSGFGETMGMPAPTGRWLRRGNAIAVLGL
ncbi:peptidoglycan-binding domain-containing protein [Thiocapsa sp.]|uniref:peptidoglycan-binding domain-containing protein n=1 Tax=Thiocapsa sp. TaxID=2024551 RepID=UPI0025D1C9C5|nr:peptidoglycan-binding domain-containing protein [Thiocapsa sp.]